MLRSLRLLLAAIGTQSSDFPAPTHRSILLTFLPRFDVHVDISNARHFDQQPVFDIVANLVPFVD